MSKGYPMEQVGKVFTPNAASGNGAVTNAATNYQVFAANPEQQHLRFQNTNPTAIIWANDVGLAYDGSYKGMAIQPYGIFVFDISLTGRALNVASATAGATYFAVEG